MNLFLISQRMSQYILKKYLFNAVNTKKYRLFDFSNFNISNILRDISIWVHILKKCFLNSKYEKISVFFLSKDTESNKGFEEIWRNLIWNMSSIFKYFFNSKYEIILFFIFLRRQKITIKNILEKKFLKKYFLTLYKCQLFDFFKNLKAAKCF